LPHKNLIGKEKAVMSHGKLIIWVCVAVMTIGQLLFKQVAINYNKAGTLLDIGVIGLLFVAGSMYIVSSGLWVWALRSVEVSKAYPYFALGFVFVPLLGAWLFGESLTLRYGLGVMLIVIGVSLTSTS
jgi:drug/metabolite transporter (DMT)-like permease